ncbi:MAG: ribonuclease HII [Acidobacteria bacterium]|nr:ribonuclease HII [Acidobacteriota bacterium]
MSDEEWPKEKSDFLDEGQPQRNRRKLRCTQKYERQGWRAGFRLIAGVDEVGRGALFGPVLAAAVILDPSHPIPGLQDSKQLSARTRQRLAGEIRSRAIGWAVSRVEPAQIDRINILQASRLAMRDAVLALQTQPDWVLVDAVRLDINIPQVSIIHGDACSVSIAAASILAKVERDDLMLQWDRIYPQYGLARHKGYPTAVHKARLRQYGPSPLHRFSYAPVAAVAGRHSARPQFGPESGL